VRVLVVEDEVELAKLIRQRPIAEGQLADAAATVDAAREDDEDEDPRHREDDRDRRGEGDRQTHAQRQGARRRSQAATGRWPGSPQHHRRR
jgi:hypothetical protein